MNEDMLFAAIGRLYLQCQNMQEIIGSLQKDVQLKNSLIQDLQKSINVGNPTQDNDKVSAYPD